MPDYYGVAQAARFWNVPPWELAQQPTYWLDVAEQISTAEQHAQKIRDRQSARKQARGKRK